MQSVRLNQFFFFLRPAYRRHFLCFLSALATVTVFWPVAAWSQTTQTTTPPVQTERFDAGVGGFYQVTGAANGNFIRDDTTESGGVLVSFRQPYRPWLGYEANLGYTKFFESYNKNTVKLESNVTDLSLSYLFQSPTFYGVQAYLAIGGGIIIFSPINDTITSNATLQPPPTHLPTQLLPEFAYNFGLNYPLFSRLGVNGGLRGLYYKAPDFHQKSLDTQRLRTTLEPTLGVYYRF